MDQQELNKLDSVRNWYNQVSIRESPRLSVVTVKVDVAWLIEKLEESEKKVKDWKKIYGWLRESYVKLQDKGKEELNVAIEKQWEAHAEGDSP